MRARIQAGESSVSRSDLETQGPTVSVIIPVYNQGRYLREAIDSVLAQTWKDFELLVVDDGSTDDTPEVIASYRDRVIGLRKENGGVSSALNYGLHRARGKWVAWLSSDDVWEPNKLDRQMEAILRAPSTALVYTDFVWIDSSGTILRRLSVPTIASRRLRAIRLLWGCYINGCTAVIRRDVFQTVGLFDEGDRLTADWDFWFRVATRYELLHVPEPLVRYRIHPGQASTNILGMTQARHRDAARWILRLGPFTGTIGAFVYLASALRRLAWDLRKESTGRGVPLDALLRNLAGFFVLLVREGSEPKPGVRRTQGSS